MRKLRKQPVGPMDAWTLNLKAGDRVYERRGDSVVMYDLRESTGRNKRDVGELTPHVVKKHGVPRLAVMGDDEVWYWED